MSAAAPNRRAPDRDEVVAADDGAQRVRLRFLPDGNEVRVPSGTPIFDAASWNGIAIDSTCGGHGTCKKCKVRIVSGDVPVGTIDPRAFTPDELRDGWRLACRAGARGDLVVEVPPLQTRPKAALVGVGRHVILRPSVQKRHLVLDEPTLEDQRPDLQRVLDGLDDLEPYASVELLRTLGSSLRKANFDVTAVVCDQELIELEPGDTTGRRFAIAFDLGTTTVVATLLDLDSGQPLAVRSMLNRQQPYGADVITRISATMMDERALGALRDRAHETMAALVDEVLAEAERRRDRGVRDHRLRQRHDDAARAGDRPRAALDGAVRRRHARVPAGPRGGLRRRGPSARAGVRVPVAGRLRRRRHRRRDARHRPDPRPPAAAVHRRRHQQRDRARIGRPRARHRRARRPGLRGGADPLRDARRRRRDRGRPDRRRRARARGDR